MNNFDDKSSAQDQREFIVLSAVRLGSFSFENAEEFDRIVCASLNIDQNETPPNFLFDSGYF